MTDEKLPFISHLEELRRRIVSCIVAIGVGFALSYSVTKEIFEVLAKPLKQALPPGSSLIFTTPTEAFFVYLKTAFVSGIFLASPVILYQIWQFVSPGLYEKEKRYLIPFVLISTLLFIGGGAFGYLVVLPPAFKYLMGFASGSIQALPTMRDYFDFSSTFLLSFGVVFELPVFILLLAKTGIVSYRMLCRFQKYAVILSFLIGGILTPGPDVFSQSMMALPLLALYEISLLIARVFEKKKGGDSSELADEHRP